MLLRPWELSHRVKRQKLKVNSQREMSMRVRKGGFVASLLLRSIFGLNVLSETLYSYIKLLRNLLTCFENIILSLISTSVPKKVVFLLRNMILSFKNMTCSNIIFIYFENMALNPISIVNK